MQKTALLVAAILQLAVSAAEAKQVSPDPPRWDFGATVGWFEANPGETSNPYGDEWYGQGRYAAAIGYFWTAHLKTEIEFATTGEGSRFITDFIRIPPTGLVYPYTFEQFHRVQQASARVVWQFLDNRWVAPYVSAGLTFDVDRWRYHVPEQYQYSGDPRSNRPVLVRGEFGSGPTTDYGGSLSIGAGTKLYMTPNTYVNTGILVTHSSPLKTVSFLAGIGIDF